MNAKQIDMLMLRVECLMSGQQSENILKEFEQFIVDCQTSTDKSVALFSKLLSSKYGLDKSWPDRLEEILQEGSKVKPYNWPNLKLVKGGKND